MRLETPLGPAWAELNESGAIVRLGFGAVDGPEAPGCDSGLRQQLAEYFAGSRAVFDLPLEPAGTDFQKQVWRELKKIPAGTRITYTELARRVGHPGAARAAGRANATNPIALLIPCHRVVGSNGKLTGYLYGVERKEKLLNFELRAYGQSEH